MEARGNRDQMVIATKFTTRYVLSYFEFIQRMSDISMALYSYKAYAIGKNEARNAVGNHKKSLYLSVKDSLRKLKTDYVRTPLFVRQSCELTGVLTDRHLVLALGKSRVKPCRKEKLISRATVGPHDLNRGDYAVSSFVGSGTKGSLPRHQ